MTRIFTLTNLYPPHYLGGYELSCRDVMERLVERGHEVRVLTTTARFAGVEDAPQESRDGVYRELEFYWDDHRLLDPPLRGCVGIEGANQAALARHLDEFRPEVVSVWNMGAMSLGLLTTVIDRGVPLVLNVCDDWLVYGPLLDPWSRRLRSRPMAALARRVTGLPGAPRRLAGDVTLCFVSDYVRARARAESPMVQAGDAESTVVYSGIDAGDFPIADAQPRPWTGRLLYVGRLEDRKGVFTAVEALRSLPADHQLDLVGRGDPEVERTLSGLSSGDLAGRLRLSVVARSELAAVYRRADAFLFTSEWAEPFGLTPLEAMACGTPVIATGTGGSAEFLADGLNCLRYPPGEAGALAAAVVRLASDASIRGQLIEGGQATARQLGVDALADTLETWHEAAACRYANGRPPDRAAPFTVRG